MVSLQGPVICPAFQNKQVGVDSLMINRPLPWARLLIWGYRREIDGKSKSCKLIFRNCKTTVHCSFSPSSDGNGNMGESLDENDENYVNSCVVEADEVRPTLYHVIKDMVEMMGYSVKLVRIAKRVHGAYFAHLYLTKSSLNVDVAKSQHRKKLKMKAILRKDCCLAAISERPVNFTDDNKWIETDENVMTNFHLTLADELTSLRCTIGEQERVELLLQSLPDSYDQLIINLTNSNVISLVFDDVAAAVLQEENRRKNKEDRQVNLQQAEALTTTRGRSTERDQSSSHKHGRSKSRSKKNLKCYNCGKKGHLKNDCWSLNKNSNPQGNTANTSDDGDALCCETSTTVEGRKRYADIWLIDSGATYHMTSRREWFHHYEPVSGESVYSCNDHALEIICVGTIKLKMYDGTIKVVRDVRHVKGLKKNLLSYGLLDNNASKIETRKEIMKVIRGALVVLKGEKIAANLYMLNGETLLEAEASVASCSSDSAMLWHQKLGHMSEQGMKVLVEQKLLPGLTNVSLTLREHCITSKQHQLKFNTSNSRGKSVIELVHSDVWQAPVTSLGGAKYFVSFIDDYSRRCWVYPIKKKSDVFSTFKNFKALVEFDSGNKIKCFRTDDGGEYTSEEFDDFYWKEGIKRQFTLANTPQQNGAEAVNTTCYLVNRAPSTVIELKTPMEMWTGKPADYSNLHVFGSIMVKGYRLWDPTARKVIISRDVVFVEDKLQRKEDDDSVEKSETTQIHVEKEFEKEDSSEAEPAHDEQEPESSEAPTNQDGKPSTYQEAINSLDASLWMMAMQEEIEALYKNNIWDLVPLPLGMKPIGNKWVFKIKRNGDDQVERYRARLVVKGYAKKEGIDFNEIFSPVVRLTTVRVVLAMCATLNLHLEQLDVKTAFFMEILKKRFTCSNLKILKKKKRKTWRPNKDHIEELKAQLAREFEMEDLGSANKILGMQIHRDRSNRKIWLSQKNYLKKILSRFSMQDYSAMLCHQKLGHMSEQGMKVLVEQKLLPGLTNVSLTLREHCITKVRCVSTFKIFKERVEFDSGNKIKCFRTDNGGEYISEEFDDFCRKEGIKRQFTVANTLQQNGVVERMNKTLLERTRVILRDAGLEKSFWAEAVNTTCYLVNRAPSTVIELKTPMEMWTGKPADYSNLHVFGSIVVKRYRLWDPTARKVIISRDVVFVEDKLQRKEDDDSIEKSETTQIHVEKEFEQGDSSEAEPASSEAPTTQDGEPSTYQEAINSLDASLWMMAMQEEIEALYKNNIWDLVPLPLGRKPIGNKWVFKIKRNGDDQVERYRARLVVKGYAKKEGFDFNEIFSPVVRLTTVRVVLAMCATLNLHLEQLDVKTAFLHGNLEEEICMLQPEDFKEKEKKNLVCRLNKSLYGLKHTPRCWYKRFDSFIMCLGYNILNANHCAYFKRRPNKDHIEELKAQLAREFEMKDLGSTNKILGMQIHRDRSNRKIWLLQKNYLKKILSRFSISDSAMLWHQKLGHMSEQGMKVLVEQKLLPGLTNVSLTLREHCITSKQHQLKFNTSNSRGKSVIELVHSDVWQAPVTSLGGAKYFVSFIDDYSRRCWVYSIKKKSDVFSTFKNFKERVEFDSGNKIKCFRTYNGGEYTSEEFDDFCRKEGIKRQFTVANTLQQNGVVERMNKTLLERTRVMLRDAGLEKSFWAEAVNTTCYLVNRAPSTVIELKTPMEMWTGKPADYSNLHVFGSIVVKGYRLWDPTARKVIISRDVVFVEDKLQRKEDDDNVEKSETTQIHDGEPSTYQEAINNSDASLWMMAMQEEIEALYKNNIWDLVPLPLGRKPIGNKWVFKIKRNGDDQVERYRARLVVKGYAQKEEQLDVKTAFLHGNLEEEIYMLQPEDLMRPNKDHIEELKSQLDRKFEMKDLGSANKILGMQIHRDRSNRKIWLSQKNYLKKILSRFSMQDCKPISTPLPINFKLSSSMSPSSEEERMEMSRVPYVSAVGNLMFAMICTRPDIAQAVGVVSRYMVNPGKEHWNTVKRILRYIKGTSNVALCYGGSNLLINGYVDSDYTRDLDKNKSTTRYVFKVVGAAVSWVSKLQSVVATSTTEAEYVTTTQASKEAIWLKMLLEELGYNQEYVSLFYDSQSALHLARNPKFHSRTKYIRVQYHFIHEKVEEGTVDMQKIHTKDNIADFMTKAINADKFTWCRSSCGLTQTCDFALSDSRLPQQMSPESDETESVAFDLRPSDAINIALFGIMTLEAYLVCSEGKLSIQSPASDILPHTELDQPSGQHCLDSEEFKIVSDLNEAISQERYKDAGTLPLSAHLCSIV
ncbi:hypothetical protein F3Y22_tig00111689pilonHSYRG00088 [Hibiscus syriacus]|uniref:Retrovirus-related Pol polyprotein from transposon TNT 1-94 n=1 Tax=Hibiscus syriacus TaxID=106335 RepID=A0A6A2YIH4_HIBSY|nr:hypothetical protein F3Y22_tig00111689pilonHSYRG00088 [Hibiscus syriacus]